MNVLRFIIELFIIIFSSIPLYFSVKTLKGKTSFIKTVFIVFIGGILVSTVNQIFNFLGGIIAFFALITLYHYSFNLSWLKTIFAWVLQFIFVAILFFILLLLGIILI
jgi:hypothetical protein